MTKSATFFQQTPITLRAIRVMIGTFGALLLFSAVEMAWFYMTSDSFTLP